MAIDEIELGRLDRRLIHLDGAFVLLDEELLIGDLLLGDAVLFPQFLETREVRYRLIEHPLVVDEGALGLIERGLKRTRVDLGEKVVLVDDLAFLEPDFSQLAVDLGLDGDRRQGGHGSETGERFVDIADDGLGCADCLRLRTGVLLG